MRRGLGSNENEKVARLTDPASNEALKESLSQLCTVMKNIFTTNLDKQTVWYLMLFIVTVGQDIKGDLLRQNCSLDLVTKV